MEVRRIRPKQEDNGTPRRTLEKTNLAREKKRVERYQEGRHTDFKTYH